jgi:hypothetical protein
MENEERHARIFGGTMRHDAEVEGVLGPRRSEDAPTKIRKSRDILRTVPSDRMCDNSDASARGAAQCLAHRSKLLDRSDERNPLAAFGGRTRGGQGARELTRLASTIPDVEDDLAPHHRLGKPNGPWDIEHLQTRAGAARRRDGR